MAIARIPQVTMSEHAIRAVRTGILDGSLKPGSPLRETQLASDLGVSRAPLREALLRLEEEGLVVRIPFRGTFVAEITPRAAREIEALRSVLEPYAVECAIRNSDDPHRWDSLLKAVSVLEKRVTSHDRAGSIDAHLAVHRAIYEASGNAVLFDVWKSWEKQLRLFLAVDQQAFDLADIGHDHRHLAETIASGDLDAIKEQLAAHIPPSLPDQEPGAGSVVRSQLSGSPLLFFVGSDQGDSPGSSSDRSNDD